MNNEIAETLLKLMNLAETMHKDPSKKEEYVIKGILMIYPELSIEEIRDLISIFIGISRLTTKILFNKEGAVTECKICNIS